MPKNVTLAFDEELLAEARKYAASKKTTVNALIRDYLTAIAGQEDRLTRARRRLLELAERSTLEVGEITWKRDDVHER
jgi:Arc/MetJ family transcription regulator